MFWWRKAKPKLSEATDSSKVLAGEVVKNVVGTTHTTISMPKDQVDEFLAKLELVKKAASDISIMKEDAERVRITSQRTQDIAILGFIVLLIVVAGLVLDRLMYVWELDGKGQYEKALLKQVELQSFEVQGVRQELRQLKGCLSAGSWDGCFFK
jgi:hypothetical protein